MTIIPHEPATPLREMEIGLPSLAEVLGFLFRWWPLMAAGTVLSSFAAILMVALPQQPVYEATARVALLRYRTAAVFEPRVTTVGTDARSDTDSAAAAAQNMALYRQSLAELVVSPEIEREVVDKLRDRLSAETHSQGSLSGMVKGQVGPGGLIQIMVSNASPETALLIANTWAGAYETHVNKLYIGTQSSLDQLRQGTEEARKVYLKAEQALTDFVASSPLKELSRSVSERERLLASADNARQDAVTQLALAETRAKQEEVTRVLLAEASNRAMTLQQEQAAKNKILSAYINAAVEGKLAVIGQEVKSRQGDLAVLYGTDQQVGLLLGRAQALRDQLGAGGGSGNALALTLLKAQAFGSSQSLPQNLQLQIGEDALRLSAQDQVAEVQSLIQALQEWRRRLATAIEAKSKELLAGTGYSDVSSELVPQALAEQVRSDYLALFQLGDVAKLAQAVPEDNQLSREAREQASRLMQIPSIQQALDLQLQKTEYDELKARLEAQIRGLNQQIAVESARQKNLTLERDIAWDSYTALSRKAQELQVELLSPKQQEVQVTGEAMVKLKERQGSAAMAVAQATFLGLVVTLIVAFAADRIAAALPLARREKSAPLGRN